MVSGREEGSAAHLTPAQRERVAAAIRAAEAGTGGEVYAVLARRASHYAEVPLTSALLAALACALALALIPPPALTPAWRAAQDLAGPAELGWGLAGVLVQLLAALAAGLLTALPPVRRLLTPGWLARRRVRAEAVRQMMTRGVHLTAARTGVLLFAALEERRVEVVADAGVAALAPADAWLDVAQVLGEALKRGDAAGGFEAAAAHAGRILAAHVPRTPDDRNELSDHVAEL